MTAKSVSLLLGVVFVAVGVLGFLPNPIVAPDGLFAVNTIHNLVHLLSGVLLILGGTALSGSASLILKVFGFVYLLVAILGFVMGGPALLGLVVINAADNWLHLVLAIVILAAGFMLPQRA